MTDTNGVNEIAEMMAQHGGHGGESYYVLWTMLIYAVTQTVISAGAYFKSKTAAEESKTAAINTHITKTETAQTKVEVAKTSESVEEVKNAVNGEKKMMLAKMEEMRAEMADLQKANARLKEYKRITVEIPQTINVAMLDDDPDFCELVSEWLRHEHGTEFHIDVYGREADAAGVFLQRVHDIYIVDLNLKESDGMDFIRSLINQGHPGPFVILAGYVDSKIEQAGLIEGVQLILDKNEVNQKNMGRHLRYAVQAFRLRPPKRKG